MEPIHKNSELEFEVCSEFYGRQFEEGLCICKEFENIECSELERDSTEGVIDYRGLNCLQIRNQHGFNMRRDETYFERLRNIGTNLMYSLEIIYQNMFGAKTREEFKACVLGKEYKVFSKGEENRFIEEIQRKLANIIWFTYRRGFPKLNYGKASSLDSHVSDTGWGCMVRVCQMLLAESLKRCIQSTSRYDKYLIDNANERLELNEDQKRHKRDQILNEEIISLFLDSELDPVQSPYSIQTICNYLYDRFGIDSGKWLKPTTILLALQQISQDFNKTMVPNTDMAIEVFLEGTVYISEIVKSALGTKNDSFNSEEISSIEECENNGDFQVYQGEETALTELPFYSEPFDFDSDEMKALLKQKWKNPVTFVVLAKIGLNEPDPNFWPFIKEMLAYPESTGMIGGKPGFAYYIVGYAGDNLMYLDPHFVQETVQNKDDLKEKLDTYFCNQMRYVKYSKLDTCVAFSFFIKDEIEFHSFIRRFKVSCERKDSVLGLEINLQIDNLDSLESFDGNKDQYGFEMISINENI